MWIRRFTKLFLLLVIAALGGSCATTKTIQQNAERVATGKPVDNESMKRAVEADTKDIVKKFEETYAKLKTAVEQRWGQKDAKVPTKTVYVKYSQNYRSRVVTDFDHGLVTI